MPDLSETLVPRLDALRPLVERTAVGDFDGTHIFLTCLRSSFVRTFEFTDMTSTGNPDSAYFWVPSLRGITEDVIYIAFLSKIGHETREQVIKNMIFLEVHQRISNQRAFFRTFRPFQPVLTNAFQDIEIIRNELQAFWRGNGWPNLRQVSPPTREVAQNAIPGMLELVYDFIYRFTSGAVHFNPEQLLKLGWGSVDPEKGTIINSRFSAKHMGPYNLATCQIYGCLLLCLYFELFDEFLEPNEKEKEAVADLRKHIWRHFRWPEMVTFEEMNITVPKSEIDKYPNFLIHAIFSVVMEEGFIAGAKEITSVEARSQQEPTDSGGRP